MIFRRMKADTGENLAEGYFLSRGLFFFLLALCCLLGVLFASLFAGFNSNFEKLKTPNEKVVSTKVTPQAATGSTSPAPTAVPGINQQLLNLFSQGRFEEIVKITASLPLSLPESVSLHSLRIQSLIRLGRFAEANRAISDSLSDFPGNHELLIAAAAFFQSTGNPLAAEKMLLKAVIADPEKVGAIRGLVTTYLQAGLWGIAKDFAATGLQKFPQDPGLIHGLADSLRLLEDFPAAIKNYQEYLRLVPVAGADTHYYLGQCYLKSGAGRELAFSQYRLALQAKSSHVPALNDYSLLLATSARASEAVELIPALLEHSKEAAFALDTAGLVQLMAGHLQPAESLMLKAHAAEPENSEFSAHISLLYRCKNDQEKAEEWKDKALAQCHGDLVLLKRVLDELKAYQQ